MACYQTVPLPPPRKAEVVIHLLGFCPRYIPNLKVKDLTFDMEEATSRSILMDIDQTPEQQVFSLVIPDFFVFKGRPVFPDIIEATPLCDDLHKFWLWLKGYSERNAQVIPCPLGPARTSQDVLFYYLLMVAFDSSFLNQLLSMYGAYLKVHLKTFIPDARQRMTFAWKLGLAVSGPDEVEQKLLSVVQIEAGRLRDEKDSWQPRVPRRLQKIMAWIENWFEGTKKK